MADMLSTFLSEQINGILRQADVAEYRTPIDVRSVIYPPIIEHLCETKITPRLRISGTNIYGGEPSIDIDIDIYYSNQQLDYDGHRFDYKEHNLRRRCFSGGLKISVEDLLKSACDAELDLYDGMSKLGFLQEIADTVAGMIAVEKANV